MNQRKTVKQPFANMKIHKNPFMKAKKIDLPSFD